MDRLQRNFFHNHRRRNLMETKCVTTMVMEEPQVENNNNNESLSGYSNVPKVMWDWICWTGAKTYDGMDFAGEVVADFLGLTRSKYQWILDMQEREREEKRLRRLEARQRRQLRLEQLLEEEKKRLQALEKGDSGIALDEDVACSS